MFHYRIRPDSDIPIYRQLVDQINAEIRSGALKAGTQLPTVREMAAQLNLSCGTVKRVYDRLQEMGDIEMTRRRGTFVKYVRSDTDSRKLQAMQAIDRMIRQLSDLNFSPAEIHIFVNLKMREWGLKWSGVRIALVTDLTDSAPMFEEQLNQIGNVNVMTWRLKQVREYPYNIDEQSDVILASSEDAQKLEPLLPDRSKLIRIAVQPRPDGMFALARCADQRPCVICQDKSFAHAVRDHLPADAHAQFRYALSSDPEACAALIGSGDAVILSESTHALLKTSALPPFAPVHFDYEIDEGSMIYLEERISRVREARQLEPGALHMESILPRP